MSITALSLHETEDYICEDDKKSKNPTVWKLGTYSHKIRAYLLSLMGTMGDKDPDFQKTFDASIEAVRLGLKGWENFLDGNQKEIKFLADAITESNTGGVDESLLNRIPQNILIELAGALIQKNMVSGTERKNS